MKLAELKERFHVGSRWKTEFELTGKIAEDRTVIKVQSNGCWFSPAPWADGREGFLSWPKASCIVHNSDRSITLTHSNGNAFATYWELD